jgi:hypothetical protein
MPGDLDRSFANKEEAKAELRSAVQYLLRDVSESARGDTVRDIVEIVRQVVNGLPSSQPNPFDDDAPGG